MKLRTGIFAALIAVALEGCGPGDYCNRGPACPNDPVRTQSQRDQCLRSLDANKNSPCIAENLAASTCIVNSTLCTSQGKTDLLNTLIKAQNECGPARTAFSNCCQQHAGATACFSSF